MTAAETLAAIDYLAGKTTHIADVEVLAAIRVVLADYHSGASVTVPATPEFDPPTRQMIETWQRAAMIYGWKMALMGLPQPDPLFVWQDDVPVLVTDSSVPATGSAK